KVRRKDGKQHRYWSVVENTRVAGGRMVQRHVLYLGEINDSQELAWRRSIEVLEDGAARPRTRSLFPDPPRRGNRRDPACRSSSWRKKASSMSWRKAAIASPNAATPVETIVGAAQATVDDATDA